MNKEKLQLANRKHSSFWFIAFLHHWVMNMKMATYLLRGAAVHACSAPFYTQRSAKIVTGVADCVMSEHP